MRKILTYLLITFSISLFAQKVDLNYGKVQSSAYYGEFDFEFVKSKIIVPVDINNRTYKFILDTGAPNIISKELDSLLKPTVINEVHVSDANNVKDTLKVVSIDNLKFGNITFEDTHSLVHDLNDIPVFECFGVDGFIGSNMLRNSIIQIDLKNKKIRLTNNRKKLDLNKKMSSKIKLTKNQSNPYVWIRLRGKDDAKEQLLIDTGANGLYDIALGHFQIFEKKKIFKKIGESVGASSISLFGAPNASKHYKLLLESMKINGLEINNLITNTTNDDSSRIGSDILKYGTITIDYANKRFYMKPIKDKIDLNERYFGFNSTLKERKLIVGFVWEADLKKKIKYGDEIIKINDLPVEICDLLNKQPFYQNNDTIKLKIKPVEGEVFEMVVNKKTTANIGNRCTSH